MKSANLPEVDQLITKETGRVMQHIRAKLPPEILEHLTAGGGLKDQVRKYLNRYTPRDVAELLTAVGGADRFNTGEIEKSLVNMYGHLQGHIQQGIHELENRTNSLLRQKSDIGAFIRGDSAYSLVKCVFKDNPVKPKTVTDVKLSVNIPDAELVSPIFHYQAAAEYLIKDLLSRRIIDTIDQEIEKLKDERIDLGEEELSETEVLLVKIGQVEEYTDDKADDPKSKRYALVAKNLMDRLGDLQGEQDPAGQDPLNVRENLKKILDTENIRDRGFNTAVNALTSILDRADLGYQYIENLKNARELLIREYEEADAGELPDERYQVRLRYYDKAQLLEERRAYDAQMQSFEAEARHLWDMLQVIYEDGKSPFRVADFRDMARKLKGRIRVLIKAKTGEPLYEDREKLWDELSFVGAEETDVEKLNRSYIPEKDKLRRRLGMMGGQIQDLYGSENSPERRILEERLTFLEKEYVRFEGQINPYHVQPGLLLDVDISSIKRKKTTLNAMADVITEFLQGVSKGFQDAALGSFSRQGSAVRRSLDGGPKPIPDAVAAPAEDYLNPNDDHNDMAGITAKGIADFTVPKPAPVPRGRKSAPRKGVTDEAAVPAAKPAKSGKPRTGRKGPGSIREV
jgi:hypothetical protein